MARTPQLSNQLQIDQATLSPAGTPGKARTDGKAGGQLVTLTNTGTGTTTRFRLLDVPLGDTTAALSLTQTGPKVWTFSPTAAVYGSYRIELTEDLGLSTEYTEIHIFGIRTPTAGLLLPALGEHGDPSASLVNAGASQIAAAENNSDDSTINTALNSRQYAAWLRPFLELFLKVEAGGGVTPGSLAGAGLVVNGVALDVNPGAGGSIVVSGDAVQRAALTGAITASQDSNATAFAALAAKSVLANATNASAVPAALAGSAAFQHLRVNAANNALEWSVLTTGDFPANSVPLTALPSQASDTYLGNVSGSSGSPTANNLSALAGPGLTFSGHQFASAVSGTSSPGYLSRILYANALSAAVGTTVCGVTVQAAPAAYKLTDLSATAGNWIRIDVWGSGGGGAPGSFTSSGTSQTSSSDAAGGGGGCHNWAIFSRKELIDFLASDATLTVPLGGAQKTGSTTAGTTTVGNPGAICSFGTLIGAGGGGGGGSNAGTTASGGAGGGAYATGGNGSSGSSTGGGNTGAGLSGWDKVGAGGIVGPSTPFSSGGGGAAGGSTGNTSPNAAAGGDAESGGCGGGGGGGSGDAGAGGGSGGAGGRCHAANGTLRGSGPSGGGTGNPPGGGTPGSAMANWMWAGDGGSGGGGARNLSVHGGDGGAGGFPAGGGGAGGSGHGANGTAWGGVGGAGGDAAIGLTFYP